MTRPARRDQVRYAEKKLREALRRIEERRAEHDALMEWFTAWQAQNRPERVTAICTVGL